MSTQRTRSKWTAALTAAAVLAAALPATAQIGGVLPPGEATVPPPAPARAAGPSPFRLPPAAELDDFLPPEQAFVMNARFDAANELTVSWQIEPGYYLYRDKFEFSATGGLELGAPSLPAGQAHYDGNFGDVHVFYGSVEVVVPFARPSGDAIPVEITAAFQGCKEDSVCYPPMQQSMALTLPAASEFAATAGPAPAAPAEQDRWSARTLGARMAERRTPGRAVAAALEPRLRLRP